MKEKLIKELGDRYSEYLDDCMMFINAIILGLKPKYVPNSVIELSLRTGLIEKTLTGGYTYVGEETQIADTWDWVFSKFLQEFININLPSTKYYKTQLKGRMKKFIVGHAKNGVFVTPLEIIEATKLYCRIKANENLFAIREPRYFIFKGTIEESDLLDYIYKIREDREITQNKEDKELSNLSMQ
jgi:hypothetical protein